MSRDALLIDEMDALPPRTSVLDKDGDRWVKLVDQTWSCRYGVSTADLGDPDADAWGCKPDGMAVWGPLRLESQPVVDDDLDYVRHSLGIVGDRQKIYISGAIMYANNGVDLFAEAEAKLFADGWDPLNPKSVDACDGKDCERQQHEIDKGMEHSWGCFLKHDLKAMLDCCAIYMLPGWEQSHGARLELQVASAVGLKVIFA